MVCKHLLLFYKFSLDFAHSSLYCAEVFYVNNIPLKIMFNFVSVVCFNIIYKKPLSRPMTRSIWEGSKVAEHEKPYHPSHRKIPYKQRMDHIPRNRQRNLQWRMDKAETLHGSKERGKTYCHVLCSQPFL